MNTIEDIRISLDYSHKLLNKRFSYYLFRQEYIVCCNDTS